MTGMKRTFTQSLIVVLALATILWSLVRTLRIGCASGCDVVVAGFLMQVGLVMLVAIAAWVLTLQMERSK